MDIGSILVGLALLAIIAFVLAQPFLINQGVAERAVTRAEALRAERDQVLDALRDLDFDHTMGKITTEDYQPQRALLVARGVDLLKQLDALAGGPPAGPSREDQLEAAIAARRQAAPAADPLEAAIAARRKSAPAAASAEAAPAARRPGAACAQCGTPAQPGDRFCAKCGASLAQPAACAQCGTPFKTGDRFCAKCGTAVPDAAVTGAA